MDNKNQFPLSPGERTPDVAFGPQSGEEPAVEGRIVRAEGTTGQVVSDEALAEQGLTRLVGPNGTTDVVNVSEALQGNPGYAPYGEPAKPAPGDTSRADRQEAYNYGPRMPRGRGRPAGRPEWRPDRDR